MVIPYFKPGLWLGWAALVRQPDCAGLGWAGQAARRGWARLGWPDAGQAAGWAGLARRPDSAGLGWQAARLGWAGLAELSEQWQVVVKWRIQAPTGITDSMDQCGKVDM